MILIDVYMYVRLNIRASLPAFCDFLPFYHLFCYFCRLFCPLSYSDHPSAPQFPPGLSSLPSFSNILHPTHPILFLLYYSHQIQFYHLLYPGPHLFLFNYIFASIHFIFALCYYFKFSCS